MSALSDLSPISTRAFTNLGPKFLSDTAQSVVSLIPDAQRRVGQALLQNPALRGLSISQLANRLQVPEQTARAAVGALVASVERAGGPSIAHMTGANDLASRLSTGTTFDQAMARYASGAASRAFSPNMGGGGGRPRPVVLNWLRAAGGGFMPHIGEARGLDSTGLAYIVESGDSMSKIASKLVGSSGRVGELIRANPQVKDANRIQVGQRLNLPASWQTAPKVAPQQAPLNTQVSPTTAPVSLPTLPVPLPASSPSVAAAMPTISEIAKSSGPPVKAWQLILIRDGFAPAGSDDSQFGPNTTTRTKAWQTKKGLKADGVVGPKTWAAALATLPTSMPGAPAASPTVLSTPLGPLSLPALPSIFTPTSTTIAENPAAPIPTILPQLPPASVPTVSRTTAPDGSVVTATTPGGSSVTTIAQAPIEEKPSGILPVLFLLGSVALLGMGSGKKLF